MVSFLTPYGVIFDAIWCQWQVKGYCVNLAGLSIAGGGDDIKAHTHNNYVQARMQASIITNWLLHCTVI